MPDSPITVFADNLLLGTLGSGYTNIQDVNWAGLSEGVITTAGQYVITPLTGPTLIEAPAIYSSRMTQLHPQPKKRVKTGHDTKVTLRIAHHSDVTRRGQIEAAIKAATDGTGGGVVKTTLPAAGVVKAIDQLQLMLRAPQDNGKYMFVRVSYLEPEPNFSMELAAQKDDDGFELVLLGTADTETEIRQEEVANPT